LGSILKLEHHNITFLRGFETNWQSKVKTGDVLVVDDLFQEANKEQDFNNLFTKIVRHREMFVIFTTQNLFHAGGHHRTRNLNVNYVALFRNPRDQTVIDYLARQMYPANREFLISAFNDATHNKPYSYLFLDFTQECDDSIRVRSNLFEEEYVTVYSPPQA